MSVNKVILIGRLGQDPEMKYTPSGVPVCNFSLATSEGWKDKASGQRTERTEWHRIVVWNKLAEFCNQYLSKGRQVFLEGRLQTRSWDDKSGNKRYTTEIVASTVQFIGSEKGGDQKRGGDMASGPMDTPHGAPPADMMGQMGGGRPQEIVTDANFTTDDIPF